MPHPEPFFLRMLGPGQQARSSFNVSAEEVFPELVVTAKDPVSGQDIKGVPVLNPGEKPVQRLVTFWEELHLHRDRVLAFLYDHSALFACNLLDLFLSMLHAALTHLQNQSAEMRFHQSRV